MDLIRDDKLVALNDLIVACREAAAFHATAADLAPESGLARDLAALSETRRSQAEELAAAVVEKDDIPNAPSGEKELLDAALARLKSAVSEDETEPLLDDCQAKEDRVAELASALLGHDLEPGLRDRVAALHGEATSRLAELRRARPSS